MPGRAGLVHDHESVFRTISRERPDLAVDRSIGMAAESAWCRPGETPIWLCRRPRAAVLEMLRPEGEAVELRRLWRRDRVQAQMACRRSPRRVWRRIKICLIEAAMPAAMAYVLAAPIHMRLAYIG